MNEIILFIVVIAVLFGSQVLIRQIKRPLLHYIRILAAIALILFVWLFSRDGSIPVKVILSIIGLTGIYKGYLSIKKLRSD